MIEAGDMDYSDESQNFYKGKVIGNNSIVSLQIVGSDNLEVLLVSGLVYVER